MENTSVHEDEANQQITAVKETEVSHFHDTDSETSDKVVEEYTEKVPPPPRPRFYRQKRYWIVCSILTAIIVAILVPLILFVFFPMIAQWLMDQAGISVKTAQITFTPPDTLIKRSPVDMNSTFYMAIATKLSNTGPFSADLRFHNPIRVYYNDTLLGSIELPDSKIAGGSGELDADTPFSIANTSFFAAFARDMLAKESFRWRLQGKLDITALTRTATVDLNKDVSILGMNGFPNVNIQSFELPGDDPNGGILMALGCRLVSPSPVGVQLGTIKLKVAYDGVDLGDVTANDFSLKQGDNDILLKGTLKPQTDPAALDKVGALFTNYVSGKMSLTTATGLSAAPNGRDPITWLTEGFQSVKLNVQLGVPEPLKIIHSVDMGYLDLQFSKAAPYAPVLSAPKVVAGFKVPFGFSLNIYNVMQTIQLSTEHAGKFATIQVPFVPAQTDQQNGLLQFGMADRVIQVNEGKESDFNDFTYGLTASDLYPFKVGGEATAKMHTPLGNITMGGIIFEVPTQLHGLRFLNSTPTVINSVDVTGGTPKYMQLTISVTMENPSDFSIATGDVYFNLLSKDAWLGSVSLAALKLNRGSNTLTAGANFNPKGSDEGQTLLGNFVMGADNTVKIAGHDSSTEITSLVHALGSINIESVLPGLKKTLVKSASLAVLESSVQTGLVKVKVGIENPFTATLMIRSIKAAATYKGVPVGNIDQDVSSIPIVIPGHTIVESSPLDMIMNLQPAAIAFLVRDLAASAHMDTRPLDALLKMGGFEVEGQQDVTAVSSMFTTFNVSNFVLETIKYLKVDLQLEVGLTVGEYLDSLKFSQLGISTSTDESITRLIPVVGQPIVQQLLDGAIIGFKTIMLYEPTDGGFKVQIEGSITETGPLAAVISFPEQLAVAWQGKKLGMVSVETIHAAADVGAQFNISGVFTITDQDAMGEFATYLINSDEFIWEIYTDSVTVDALGFTFQHIHLQKFVKLKGAQGFKDCVSITSFDLPANDPAGGIQLNVQTVIRNPSQIGFTINSAGFEPYFEGVFLGPLASDGPAVFAPLASGNIALKGRLVRQDTPKGLEAIAKVFTNYISATNSILTIKGTYGSGPNGQVGWLTTGFKSINIENVVLPGPSVKPELIPAITLKELTLDFTQGAYRPPTSSRLVEALIKSPFGFPLGVSSLSMDVAASYQGSVAATLGIPTVPATTSPTNVVSTQFSNVPFIVPDNAHPVFNGFVSALTVGTNVPFGLSGSANALANTAVGDLPLKDIAFNVGTSLNGFNNFGGTLQILELTITGGTPDYIEVMLKIQFNNPSQITITIGDLNLDAIMNEKDTNIGTASLKSVTIAPGNNVFDTTLHLMNPARKDVINQLVSIYVTHSQAPLTITGSPSSTSIESLKDALSTVRLATTFMGINNNLLVKAEVQAQATVVVTRKAKVWVTLNNPLRTSYTVRRVSVAIQNTNNGQPYDLGSIVYDLPSPLSVPAGGQVRSDEWPVDVHADLVHLVELVGKPSITVNIQLNVTAQVGDTNGGYTSEFYYYQDAVTCMLDIQLLGISLPTLPNGTVTQAVGSVVSGAAGVVSGVAQDVGSVVSGVTGAVSDIPKEVGSVVNGVTDTVSNISKDVGSVVSGVTGAVPNLPKDAGAAVSGATESVTGGVNAILSGVGNVAAPKAESPTPPKAESPAPPKSDNPAPPAGVDTVISGVNGVVSGLTQQGGHGLLPF